MSYYYESSLLRLSGEQIARMRSSRVLRNEFQGCPSTMRFRPPIPLLLFSIACLILPFTSSTSTDGERYSESLRLTPFPDGKLHSNFRFELSGPWTEEAPLLDYNINSKLYDTLAMSTKLTEACLEQLNIIQSYLDS